MTALRHHPITGEPILFAPQRASRPNAFGTASEPGCPFCPGHEHETPPEVLRAGDPWRIRVFPNKFPAAAHHEVIVESEIHDITFDRIADAASVIGVYVERYRALAVREGVAYVALFRNHGAAGGASIAHPHAQVVGVPFVPPRIAREGECFSNAASCPLCRLREHAIGETSHFVWVAPAGSQMPHEQWIVPKQHRNEIGGFGAEEIRELAALLQEATAAMQRRWPSYNWLFLNFPRTPAAHCYVALFPRLTGIAGFELETGTSIQIVDPAETSRIVREP